MWNNLNPNNQKFKISTKMSSIVTYIRFPLQNHSVVNINYPMCNINHPKLPCRICTKNVHDKDKAVKYDLYELWIHIKCNNFNYLDYRYFQNCDDPGIV